MAAQSVTSAWLDPAPELRLRLEPLNASKTPDSWLNRPREAWPTVERGPLQESRASTRASMLNAGVGFTIDPGTLLLFGEVDVPVADHSYVGPLVQLGVSDDRFLLAPAVAIRHEFAIADTEANRVTPWVQAGLGFLYSHLDNRRGSDNDLGLLLVFGGGVELKLTERMSARFGLLIDVLPFEVFGDHLFLSVELLSLTFRL